MIDFEQSFIEVTQNYLSSSAELAAATAMCGDDPVKQDMIEFIKPQFIMMCGRAEGIRLMAKKSYEDNREFILEEMKEVTQLNLDMVRQIKEKLEPLVDLI